jgi:hypothetical protein
MSLLPRAPECSQCGTAMRLVLIENRNAPRADRYLCDSCGLRDRVVRTPQELPPRNVVASV